MNQQAEWQQAFARLKNLITERQAFEAARKYTPYSALPTTLDFHDINDKSLLFYAIVLGDEQAVISLLNQNVNVDNAIADALRHGQLNIAKCLYAKNVDAFSIALHEVSDPQCKQWFTNVIKKDIEDELAYLTDKENTKRPQNRTFTSERKKINLYSRIAELGDVHLLEKVKQKSSDYFGNSDYQLMMNSSVQNDCVPMVSWLVSKGAKINSENPFKNSALIQAISSNSSNSIDFLLNHNAAINFQGEDKLTPLSWAVIKGNEELVARLLKAGADVSLADVNGRNVLHYAARTGNLVILRLLLQSNEAKQLINAPDIFGLLPKYYAAQINKQEIVGILDEKPVTQGDKVVQSFAVSQSRVMSKMLYYLKINYRDSQFFDKGGHCNGFTFLEEMYSDEGRADYYYDTLRLISEWNGEQETLLQPFDENLPQKKWYNNLAELFEQWINDVIWFHHDTLSALYRGGNSQPDQGNRMFQCQVVVSKRQPRLISSFPSANIDINCFKEILHIFGERMVQGTHLELAGSEHVTSAAIDKEKRFTYSDPNFNRRTRAFKNKEELSQVVVDTKIIANKQMAASNFDCKALFFYFENSSIKQSLDEHKAFHDHELPKSMQEAEDFQQHSPNGFSHLMVAILTGSIITIKKIIALGFYDLNAVNKHGETVLNMALNTLNQEIVDVIMSLYNASNLAPYKAFEDYKQSRREFKLKMVFRHFNKINTLLPILINRIMMNDHDNVRALLRLNNAIDINAYHQTYSPLIAALRSENLAMVNLVLEHGASLFKTDPDNPLDGKTPFASLLESNPTIITSLLKTQFKNINQEDGAGKSIIHYLPEAKSSVALLVFDEIINRGGDVRKVAGDGKTIFDILKYAYGTTKYLLYSKLLPMLDRGVEADAAILNELHQNAALLEDTKMLDMLRPHCFQSSILNP